LNNFRVLLLTNNHNNVDENITKLQKLVHICRCFAIWC